jgi:hypothetical protein
LSLGHTTRLLVLYIKCTRTPIGVTSIHRTTRKLVINTGAPITLINYARCNLDLDRGPIKFISSITQVVLLLFLKVIRNFNVLLEAAVNVDLRVQLCYVFVVRSGVVGFVLLSLICAFVNEPAARTGHLL